LISQNEYVFASDEESRMAMKKSIPAANPDAYVAALSGWRRAVV